jgi:hypothetical protein
MTQYTIRIDEAVAETVREDAQRRKVSEEQCAAQILAAHHQAFLRFPDGVLRLGRQKVIDLLSPIPCLSRFASSGVDFRYWWVSFELDISSPIAWQVVCKLGLLLNTESVEMMLPTAFKPTPNQWSDQVMSWRVESTAPRLDPADVAHWLSAKLPQPIGDESAWLRAVTI